MTWLLIRLQRLRQKDQCESGFLNQLSSGDHQFSSIKCSYIRDKIEGISDKWGGVCKDFPECDELELN